MRKVTPTLFQPDMVRASWNDLKTNTRRIAKELIKASGVKDVYHRPDGLFIGLHLPLGVGVGITDPFPCPYGGPGDLIYLREKMRVIDVIDHGSKVAAIRVMYEATKTKSDWITWPERLQGTPVIGKCLAYGGFREASRMTLELTNVKVERVQDISNEDAVAEGIGTPTDIRYAAIDGFRPLWDSINAKRGYGWESNPWVWVLKFRVHKMNVDQFLMG